MRAAARGGEVSGEGSLTTSPPARPRPPRGWTPQRWCSHAPRPSCGSNRWWCPRRARPRARRWRGGAAGRHRGPRRGGSSAPQRHAVVGHGDRPEGGAGEVRRAVHPRRRGAVRLEEAEKRALAEHEAAAVGPARLVLRVRTAGVGRAPGDPAGVLQVPLVPRPRLARDAALVPGEVAAVERVRARASEVRVVVPREHDVRVRVGGPGQRGHRLHPDVGAAVAVRVGRAAQEHHEARGGVVHDEVRLRRRGAGDRVPLPRREERLGVRRVVVGRAGVARREGHRAVGVLELTARRRGGVALVREFPARGGVPYHEPRARRREVGGARWPGARRAGGAIGPRHGGPAVRDEGGVERVGGLVAAGAGDVAGDLHGHGVLQVRMRLAANPT